MYLLSNADVWHYSRLFRRPPVSDYHAPVRHGTSFERRTTRSQTAYVPQQSYPQHGHVNRPQISARLKTTVNITPSPNPVSSTPHQDAPQQSAAHLSSVTFLQQSVSQPSLTQGFQNLNISANDGAANPAAAPGPKSRVPAGDSTGHAVEASVRRSHSFTSPSNAIQQQYPYGELLIASTIPYYGELLIASTIPYL